MPDTVHVVSYPAKKRVNVGAYDQPYSGVGIEYLPLGAPPDAAGITLHETGYLPDSEEWNFPGVYSPFWRLYYNSKRGHCMLFGERMVELTPEHVVVVPDHCLFHGLGGGPTPIFWIAFSLSRQLDRRIVPPVILSPDHVELCLIERLQRMILLDVSWTPTDEILHCSLALLHVVLSRPDFVWRPPEPGAVRRVREHVRVHLSEPLRNRDLARVAGLSVEGLYRMFRACLRTTPARWVAEIRVAEACRMLLQAPASIDEIAAATGFPDRAYFSRVFRRITRQSPAAFRRKNRPFATR